MGNAQTVEQAARGVRVGHDRDDRATSAAPAGDVTVGATATQISTGYEHTCAPLLGGALRCWGASTFGQLGYGNTNAVGDNETPAVAGNVPL